MLKGTTLKIYNMKNITKYFFVAVCTVMLFSCVDSDKKAGHSDLYYPVEKLVDVQIDSLKKSSGTWKKTVDDDGALETKTLAAKDIDWETELAMFYDLTPNKNAYAGKFQIDTVIKPDGKTITYSSVNLKLTQLVIHENNDGNVAIYGDIQNSNVFYTSYYQLDFVPYKAFAISGVQTLNFFNSQKKFTVSWIKENPDSTFTANNP